MAVLGPNCIGAANFADSAFLSSADGLEPIEAGGTALIAQSGSLAIAVGSRPSGRFRYMISTGNEAVVTTSAIISHLLRSDPGVETFALIMEAIRDRDGLVAAARAARQSGKRIVLLKLSGSEASSRIAALHTGAVSGDFAPVEAFCEAHGILLARTLRQFNAVLTLLSATSYRGGHRLGIFTTSGGTAVLSAGFAGSCGLSLPEPPQQTRSLIAEILGTSEDRITNPLDTAGIFAFDAGRFGNALGRFADSGAYDLVLVPLGGAGGGNAADRVDVVAKVATQSSVPIVPVWQQQRLLEEDAFARLYRSGLAMYMDFESPTEAMALIAGAQASSREPVRASVGDGAALSLEQGLSELAGHGVPVPAWMTVDADTAPDAVIAGLGLPLALKVSHPRLLHKSDSNLVVFPVESASALTEEARRLRDRSAGLGPRRCRDHRAGRRVGRSRTALRAQPRCRDGTLCGAGFGRGPYRNPRRFRCPAGRTAGGPRTSD